MERWAAACAAAMGPEERLPEARLAAACAAAAVHRVETALGKDERQVDYPLSPTSPATIPEPMSPTSPASLPARDPPCAQSRRPRKP